MLEQAVLTSLLCQLWGTQHFRQDLTKGYVDRATKRSWATEGTSLVMSLAGPNTLEDAVGMQHCGQRQMHPSCSGHLRGEACSLLCSRQHGKKSLPSVCLHQSVTKATAFCSDAGSVSLLGFPSPRHLQGRRSWPGLPCRWPPGAHLLMALPVSRPQRTAASRSAAAEESQRGSAQPRDGEGKAAAPRSLQVFPSRSLSALLLDFFSGSVFNTCTIWRNCRPGRTEAEASLFKKSKEEAITLPEPYFLFSLPKETKGVST